MINLLSLTLRLLFKKEFPFSAMKEMLEKSEEESIQLPKNTIGVTAPSQCSNEPGPASQVRAES